jgi:hypothetical protein
MTHIAIFIFRKNFNIHAIGKHPVEPPVVLDQAGRVGPRDLTDSLANGIRRDVRVDILKRGLKPPEQDNLVVIPTFTGWTIRADVGTERRLPAEALEPVEGSLFENVF